MNSYRPKKYLRAPLEALTLSLLLFTGCGAVIHTNGDGGKDAAGLGDQGMARDLSLSRMGLDGGPPVDSASLPADSAGLDLIAAGDLAAGPMDAAAAKDFAVASDLSVPVLPVDSAVPPDLSVPDLAQFVPIAGLHTPLPIDPDVNILDGQWLLDLYRTVLAREHDAGGYKVNFAVLQSGGTRSQIYSAFTQSQEFATQPALHDRSGFITRLYQVLLQRAPSAPEVAAHVAMLCSFDGKDCPQGGLTWPQMIDAFYGAAEYKARNCETGYYTLGARVGQGSLLLRNLFDGTARFQTIAESQPISLTVPSALGGALWDQKLPILDDPSGNGYLAFTRALQTNQPERFTIVLLGSKDGIAFTEIGPVFDRSGSQTFYDPHIAIDNGFCPRRYVMAMECLGNLGGASLCTAQTSTPNLPETWPRPGVLVDGCPGGGACGTQAAQSASTGVTLSDGKNHRYVAWTQVYDGVKANDPLAHTYSQGLAVPWFAGNFGNVMKANAPIATLLSAEPNIACNDVWDCNNRDKQDWKREADQFYALYNGANYYRCTGATGNGAGVNRWGISVARSATAIGAEYTDRLEEARVLFAEREDVCGISYPMLNVLGGELFVYYAYYPKAGGNRTMRARLVAR